MSLISSKLSPLYNELNYDNSFTGNLQIGNRPKRNKDVALHGSVPPTEKPETTAAMQAETPFPFSQLKSKFESDRNVGTSKAVSFVIVLNVLTRILLCSSLL